MLTKEEIMKIETTILNQEDMIEKDLWELNNKLYNTLYDDKFKQVRDACLLGKLADIMVKLTEARSLIITARSYYPN